LVVRNAPRLLARLGGRPGQPRDTSNQLFRPCRVSVVCSLQSAFCLPLRKLSLNSPVDSRSTALPNPARLRHSPAEPPPRLQRPPILSSRVPPCRKQPLRSSTERAPSTIRPSSAALCQPSAAASSQTVPGLACGQARARRFTLDPCGDVVSKGATPDISLLRGQGIGALWLWHRRLKPTK
jgi:hypothetical protein